MLSPMSMEPWAATKRALRQCGDDISPCPGPYSMAACPEFHFGCRLSWELFALPLYYVLTGEHIFFRKLFSFFFSIVTSCFSVLTYVSYWDVGSRTCYRLMAYSSHEATSVKISEIVYQMVTKQAYSISSTQECHFSYLFILLSCFCDWLMYWIHMAPFVFLYFKLKMCWGKSLSWLKILSLYFSSLNWVSGVILIWYISKCYCNLHLILYWIFSNAELLNSVSI